MNYQVQTSEREFEDVYYTGIIAFKKEKYKLVHFLKVDYTSFFKDFDTMAKTIEFNSLRYLF